MRNKELVIAFPLKNGNVLLGTRKKDPWKGKLSGFGGNIEKEDKSPLSRQVLELWEEAKIMTSEKNLDKRAEFEIKIEDKKIPKILHIYIVHDFSGLGRETGEMYPIWLSLSKSSIFIKKMISGDEEWVPKILEGKFLTGTIFRDKRLNLISCDIREIKQRPKSWIQSF